LGAGGRDHLFLREKLEKNLIELKWKSFSVAKMNGAGTVV
jgi:hypothetical protein